MSTFSALPALAAIAEQVVVLSEHTYQVRGQELPVAYQQAYTRWAQPLQHFGQNPGDESLRRANLLGQLAQTLYHTFYAVGDTTGPPPAAPLPLPPPAERAPYIARLAAANTTPDGFDPCWRVYVLDAHGNAFVTKNDQVRQLAPGEWEADGPPETALRVGTVVRLRLRRDDTTMQPVFYQVRGTMVVPQQAEFVRIYFHTTFAGAELLVHELTQRFNRYRLPFFFKCLNHPDLFTRVDSAVLYLNKFDVRFASRLLAPVLAALGPYLRAGVPLFTRALRPGVSFAEDPGHGQSFGMSRCTLLAEALVRAHDKQLPPGEAQLAEIRRAVQRHGLDEAHLYRNPNSHLAYPFAALAGNFPVAYA